MLSTNVSLYSPARTRIRSSMPMQAQTAGSRHIHAMDTLSLTFGAGNKTPEELKKALGLGTYATEDEFQEARTKHLAKIFTFDSKPFIQEKRPITKANLISLIGIPSNSSKEELLKVLKSNMQSQNLHAKKEEIDLQCAIVLAYPPDHPFDYPGRTLG